LSYSPVSCFILPLSGPGMHLSMLQARLEASERPRLATLRRR